MGHAAFGDVNDAPCAVALDDRSIIVTVAAVDGRRRRGLHDSDGLKLCATIRERQRWTATLARLRRRAAGTGAADVGLRDGT